MLHRLFILNTPSECITRPYLVVNIMVRFFDKLKGSFGKKQPSTPPEDPQSTAPDPGTALATSSPAVVEDASSVQRSSETASKPESSPVVLTHPASVKRSRVRVRRVMRPRPVIRERHMTPPKDSDSGDKSVSSSEPITDIEDLGGSDSREESALSPKPMTDIEDLEDSDSGDESVSRPEPVTDIEDSEKPALSSRHVIMRKPKAQKRLRKVRVVKPKVRVVR